MQAGELDHDCAWAFNCRQLPANEAVAAAGMIRRKKELVPRNLHLYVDTAGVDSPAPESHALRRR
jgi:hypothetical protein